MDCREALVQTALGELGVSAPGGEDKYISWYNRAEGVSLPLTVSWCAIFVSWCARRAGGCAGGIPNYASCTHAVKLFQRAGAWRDRGGYTPQRGDLIFFDWNREPSISEHTGIVTGVRDGWVQTVEGNSGTPGAVRQKSYALASALILGYGVWGAAAAGLPPVQPGNERVKAAQAALNTRYKAGLAVDGAWGPASRAAAVKALQTELNAVYQKGLAVDGRFGPATRAQCPTLRRGEKNGLVWVLQVLLTAAGATLALDGSYGPGTEGAVVAFQKGAGQTADGAAGAALFAALVK